MEYYLKKLGHQELGSINSPGDRPSRGRYIYISKDTRILSFFPSLSRTVKNDSSLLPIIPLYLAQPEKIYCNYIYHNDKYNGSTSKRPRDEYRIYSNNHIEMNKLLFGTNDIIILKKEEISVGEDKQQVYFLELLSNKSTALYEKCSKIIDDSPVNNHVIFNGVIAEMEIKIAELLIKGELTTIVDNSVTKKVKTSETNVEDLFNATSFRDFVMVGYENLCAVTRLVIKYDSFLNLEAAHIKPKSHGGLFMPNNGLALGRDIHWAFDKGFFTLKDDFSILVHTEVESEYLKSYSNKKIFIPQNPFFAPDIDNIKYHRENVFGIYLTSGRL